MRDKVVTVAGRNYRRATWPRRLLARGVDLVLLCVACTLAGTMLLPLTVPLSFVYLVLGDGLLAGRSIGKRFTGLKVIETRHGAACTPMQDFVRHRYLFFANPMFLLFSAYDSAQGYFDTPETYVVATTPLASEEVERLKPKPPPENLQPIDYSGLSHIFDDSDRKTEPCDAANGFPYRVHI
jgi:hypothetical protein